MATATKTRKKETNGEERKIEKRNEVVGKEKKMEKRAWLESGNYTQSAFRANVLMHWNSLFESATTAQVIGDFVASILHEATIFATRETET